MDEPLDRHRCAPILHVPPADTLALKDGVCSRHTPHKPFVTLAATLPAPPETLLPAAGTAPPCCIQGVATSQFVGVAAHEPERRPRQGSGVRRQFVAWATAHPRAFAQTAVPPARETASESEDLPALRTPSASQPVGPFVEGFVRHHPERTNRPATALQRFGPAPAGSYSGHSPTRPHFDHPRATRGHRSATPAAIGLPRFAVDFVRPVTSVVGCPTGEPPHVRPSRGGAVSAGPSGPVDFGGPNAEASPYPPMTGLFPVRHRPGSDSLARAFAPLVVELFAAGCFARTPASVASRSRLLPGRELPTPARLNGRNGFRRGSPDPLDGISDWRRVTRFEPQRPRRNVLRGFPLSPAIHSEKNRVSDRRPRLLRGRPASIRRKIEAS